MGYLSNSASSKYPMNNAYYNEQTQGAAKVGRYQYLDLSDIINNFTAAYVGEGKILQNVLNADVSFHAHRALAELHYDTFKSCKSQEIILPPSLTMRLPHDYINYTKVTWSDANGIEHIIYPTSKTSNPQTIQQNEDGEYLFGQQADSTSYVGLLAEDYISLRVREVGGSANTITANYAGQFHVQAGGEGYKFTPARKKLPADESWIKVGMEVRSTHLPPGTTVTEVTLDNSSVSLTTADQSIIEFTLSNATTNQASVNDVYFEFVDNGDDTTWGKYKNSGGNQVAIDQSTTTNLAVDADNYFQNTGERYGLDPQYAQANGSFFIDCKSGRIHFSSNLNGKTIILHYLSDGLGLDSEMIVPKLAEEAIYKWIIYGCLSARADSPEHILARFKREKFAETRKAKIRLSNIKIEEITQVLRGQSKIIKH